MKTNTKQFLFWVEAFSYGNLVKYWFVETLPDEVIDADEADAYLEKNMQNLMDVNDWSLVNTYEVVKIGYNLKTPAQKKAEAKPRKPRTKKVAVVESPIVNVIVPKLNYIEMVNKSKPSKENVYGSEINFEGSENVTQEILSAINGKKVLLIENDNGFDYSVGKFYNWMLENNVDSYALFDAKELPKEYVISKILEYDVIAFQSTFTYEESRELAEYVIGLKEPKTIFQIVINEPKFYYKPKDIVHDIYMLDSHNEDVKEWSCKQLREDKAIWED